MSKFKFDGCPNCGVSKHVRSSWDEEFCSMTCMAQHKLNGGPTNMYVGKEASQSDKQKFMKKFPLLCRKPYNLAGYLLDVWTNFCEKQTPNRCINCNKWSEYKVGGKFCGLTCNAQYTLNNNRPTNIHVGKKATPSDIEQFKQKYSYLCTVSFNKLDSKVLASWIDFCKSNPSVPAFSVSNPAVSGSVMSGSVMRDNVMSGSVMNVLSYNVCWEAFAGEQHMGHCGTNPESNKCITNIRGIITSNVWDLIALQEIKDSPVQWGILTSNEKFSVFVSNYESIFTRGGRGGITTLYNKNKYLKIGLEYHSFKTGRQICMVELQNKSTGEKIIFVNVHFPHSDVFSILKSELDLFKGGKDWSSHHIIIAGDFNDFYGNRLNTLGYGFSNVSTQIPTCCTSHGTNYKGYFDNVFSNKGKVKYDTINAKDYIERGLNYMSDHLPIFASITLSASRDSDFKPVAAPASTFSSFLFSSSSLPSPRSLPASNSGVVDYFSMYETKHSVPSTASNSGVRSAPSTVQYRFCYIDGMSEVCYPPEIQELMNLAHEYKQTYTFDYNGEKHSVNFNYNKTTLLQPNQNLLVRYK